MRRLFAAVAMLGILIAVPPGARGIADPAEAEFLGLINSLRETEGLAPYKIHPELEAKARRWADSMAQARAISHSHLEEGIQANWRKLGENVGEGPSVAELHDAFLASPSHYVNLVHKGFEYVGLGVVERNGFIYVAQEFMQLQPTPITTVPAPTPVSEPATAQALASTPAKAVTPAPAVPAPTVPTPPPAIAPAPVVAVEAAVGFRMPDVVVPVPTDTPAEAALEIPALPEVVAEVPLDWSGPAEAGPVPAQLVEAPRAPVDEAVAPPRAERLATAPPPATVERVPSSVNHIVERTSTSPAPEGATGWLLLLFLAGTGLAVIGVFQAGREFEL